MKPVTPVTRRTFGIAVLAAASASDANADRSRDGSPSHTRLEHKPGIAFDSHDADFNLYAFTKILADHDGASRYHFHSGRILSVQGDRVGQPFLDFLAIKQHRVRRLADGSWQHGYRGVILFCELGTGRVLDTFANPISGKTVSVEHFKTVMGSSIYRRDGAVSLGLTEGGTMTAPALEKRPFHLIWPAPLPTGDHVWTTYDERVELKTPDGRVLYADSSMYRYGLRRSQLLDPHASSVSDLTLSWQTQTIWWPWMQMSATPGHLLFGSLGRKYSTLDEIPGVAVTAAERRFPGQLSRPIDWRDYRLPDPALQPRPDRP